MMQNLAAELKQNRDLFEPSIASAAGIQAAHLRTSFRKLHFDLASSWPHHGTNLRNVPTTGFFRDPHSLDIPMPPGSDAMSEILFALIPEIPHTLSMVNTPLPSNAPSVVNSKQSFATGSAQLDGASSRGPPSIASPIYHMECIPDADDLSLVPPSPGSATSHPERATIPSGTQPLLSDRSRNVQHLPATNTNQDAEQSHTKQHNAPVTGTLNAGDIYIQGIRDLLE